MKHILFRGGSQKKEGEGLRASPGYFLLSYKRNVIKEYMISHVTNSPFCWRMKRINPVHGVQSPSPSESGVAAALSGFNPVHNIAQYGADFPRFPHHVIPASRSFPHASAPQRIHPSAPLDCSETWKIFIGTMANETYINFFPILLPIHVHQYPFSSWVCLVLLTEKHMNEMLLKSIVEGLCIRIKKWKRYKKKKAAFSLSES